jgi:opacity protein-like surface antigen
MRRWLALLAIAALPAIAADQPRIGVAVKFGGYLSGWFQQVQGREHAGDQSNLFALGPAVELRLTERLAVEASGLYSRIGRDAGGGYSFYPFSDRERGYKWEFPLVGKYRLPFGWREMRPYVCAGPAFEWQRTHTDWTGTTTVTNPDGSPSFVPIAGRIAGSDSTAGFTAGFGLEPRVGRARLILEGRYTIWPAGSGCATLRCVQPSQGIFLLGLGL